MKHGRRSVGVLLLALLVPGCGGGGLPPQSTASATSASSAPPAVSNRMTLLAHLSAGELTNATAHLHHDEPIQLAPGAISGSGNWGYTSPDGRRFALTGLSAGLSIVEVTDPRQPRIIALVHAQDNQWREVKTYGTYVYAVTEAMVGMDIVDMSNPDAPRKVGTYTDTFKSAHTLWIDAQRQLLFANGAGDETGRTGTHILSLEDPERPRELGVFNGFYIHDSFTRGDVLHASAIYDGFQARIDVSDPRSPRELSRFATDNRFTHSASLTADGRYLFVTDERASAPLVSWDLQNPLAPRRLGEFLARAGTIPHNVLVDGNRLLVSHYTEGVYLLDISDPARLRELGHYDTYEGDLTGFHGAWGAYMFPGTNLITVSDIDGGLFVVRYDG